MDAQVDQKGRPLGRRALETRRRLLEATAELLEKRSVREIRVVEIARRVGASPATFYQYFKDVEEAVLALAEEAADQMPDLAALAGDGSLQASRAIVDAFITHWDEYNAVLRIRNLKADEGEERFQKARIRAMRPVLDHFAEQIRLGQKTGRVRREMSDYGSAAALAAILERLAAYHGVLEALGVTRSDLVETSARILHQVVSGRASED